MFASFEGQFEKDRRIAEMSMANFRYSMVKLKTAYVGGLAQKLRISFAFASVVLILPWYNRFVTWFLNNAFLWLDVLPSFL